MITWILVIIIISGQGSATSTAVFHSPASCQEAADKAKEAGIFDTVIAYCTQDMNINE